jgi:SAM-dependent methyltransferase
LYRHIQSPEIGAPWHSGLKAKAVVLADAAALPFADQATDLVVACMSLLDINDFEGAVQEIGRVLRPGGQLCMAIVHPFISAQDEETMHSPSFGFSRPYLQPRHYVDQIERDGLGMTFSSMHRPLSDYTSALFANGMVLSALTESGDGAIPGSSPPGPRRSARAASPAAGTLVAAGRRTRCRLGRPGRATATQPR